MIKPYTLNSFVLLCLFNYGKSVPIDYCLQPLNKSDCGVKPTSVFSFYKPGSRCEIELWRGCPTFNKFPDEYLCSHHCIGKLYERNVENNLMLLDFIDPEIEDKEYDECNLPMAEGDCGVQGVFKYTFVDYLCMRVVWRGCESHNLFDDEASCMRTCKPSYQQTNSDFEDKLDGLPLEDVEAINKILDDAITNNTTQPIKKLLYNVPVEENTEPEPTEANIYTEANKFQVSTSETKEEKVETESSTDATTSTMVPTTVPIEPSDATSAMVPTTVPIEPSDATSAMVPTTVPIEPTDTTSATEVPTTVPIKPTDAKTPTPDTTTEVLTTELPVETTQALRETTTGKADKDLTTPLDYDSVEEVITT